MSHTIDANGLRIHYNTDFSGNCTINTDSESITVKGSQIVELIEEAMLGSSHFAESVRKAVRELAVQDEREACAKVAEQEGDSYPADRCWTQNLSRDIADAIRARNKETTDESK